MQHRPGRGDGLLDSWMDGRTSYLSSVSLCKNELDTPGLAQLQFI